MGILHRCFERGTVELFMILYHTGIWYVLLISLIKNYYALALATYILNLINYEHKLFLLKFGAQKYKWLKV